MKQLFLALVFEMPHSEDRNAATWEILIYDQLYVLKMPLTQAQICVSVLQC